MKKYNYSTVFQCKNLILFLLNYDANDTNTC